MKKTLFSVSLLLIAAALFSQCTKSGNYSAADHTVGLVNVTKHFKGYAYGYYKGDTLLYPLDTTHYPWTKYYYRTIDSTFSIQKVNGFLINVVGVYMNYKSTDSLTYKVVKFDTVFPGVPRSLLNYYYAKDSIYLECHHSDSLNTYSNQYYQSHIFLHTL